MVLALIVVILLSATYAIAGRQVDSEAGEAASGEQAVAPAAPNVAETVEVVRPVLKASFADGVSGEILQKVRSVPGVQAAAGVLLSSMKVEAPEGETEISVAGVDPGEFRPLAPELTANARFVWEGLAQSQSFIANEEYQILGGKRIESLAAASRTVARRSRSGEWQPTGRPVWPAC